MDEDKTVELNQKYAILYIPENCVELTLSCKVYMNGELLNVKRTLNMKAVNDAFSEYEIAEDCGYIPPDATFVVPDEVKSFLREMGIVGGEEIGDV